MNKPASYIGIDPAFREGGIGFCELSNGKVYFRKYTINQLLSDIANRHFSSSVVCVENSNLQNATFNMKGSKAEIARFSRNVGANQAVSQIICDLLKFNCYSLIQVSPRDKGSKIHDNKIIQAICKTNKLEITKKRTNQDDRDAFKLMLIAKNRKL